MNRYLPISQGPDQSQFLVADRQQLLGPGKVFLITTTETREYLHLNLIQATKNKE